MNTHKRIQGALYDYVMGELSPGEREAVERHLHGCRNCAADHARLLETLAMIPRPSDQPDAARSEEFWKTFAVRVEQETAARARRSRFGGLGRVRDAVQSLLVMRGGQVALGGLATAMAILAAVLLLRPSPQGSSLTADTSGTVQPERSPAIAAAPDTAQPEAPAAGVAAPRVQYTSDRVSQYLRRSKILLIGIANMKDDSAGVLDLHAERRTSRNLVREARYIRSQGNLDLRSQRLVDELSRILIELANLAEKDQAPGMELIRSGIRQENLLFKIRMAEVAFDTTRYTGKGTQGVL